MAIAKRATILIICFALACYVDAKKGRKRPVAATGPDVFHGQDIIQDVLLPGEIVNNVMDFGAQPDGVFDSTQAFMDAWRKTCTSPLQSRFLVPAGRFLISSMFFKGPCASPKPVTLQIVGTVLASTDISEYENGQWLWFESLNGVKIIGGGTFDGQGAESWKHTEDCEAKAEGSCAKNPSSLYFTKVTNAVVEGIKSVNPKGFHMFVTNCAHFRLRMLDLIAPGTSPNTDGIHVSHSNNVIMSRNNIATGDDCVSIIQGTTNIAIDRLKCGPGHGISIGSLGKVQDEIEVRGVHVKDSTLIGTTNGLRIKAWPGDKYPNAASDIVFSDIIMEGVKNPIIIDQEYQCTPTNCKKKPSLVKIKNVRFSNVRGTSTSPIAVDLRCSQLFPCQGVILHNVDLKPQPGILRPIASRCVNVRPDYHGIIFPSACSGLPVSPLPPLPVAPLPLPLPVPALRVP